MKRPIPALPCFLEGGQGSSLCPYRDYRPLQLSFLRRTKDQAAPKAGPKNGRQNRWRYSRHRGDLSFLKPEDAVFPADRTLQTLLNSPPANEGCKNSEFHILFHRCIIEGVVSFTFLRRKTPVFILWTDARRVSIEAPDEQLRVGFGEFRPMKHVEKLRVLTRGAPPFGRRRS